MPSRFASQSLMARQLKGVYKDTTLDRHKSPITDLIDQIIDPPAYSGGFESDDGENMRSLQGRELNVPN